MNAKVTYFINKKLKSKTVVVAENKETRISKLIEEYFAEGVHRDKKVLAEKFNPDYDTPTKKGVKGKNKDKKKVTYNIGERFISDIELIAKFKGKTKDEIVEKYIKQGIEKDKECLTSHLTKEELQELCKSYT